MEGFRLMVEQPDRNHERANNLHKRPRPQESRLTCHVDAFYSYNQLFIVLGEDDLAGGALLNLNVSFSWHLR
jgi:hypothetical protein